MKKLNKILSLASATFLLAGCGNNSQTISYDDFVNVDKTLLEVNDAILEVKGTFKTFAEYNERVALLKTKSKSQDSTLTISENDFKENNVISLMISSYYGILPLEYLGYDLVVEEVNGSEENVISFSFNFHADGKDYGSSFVCLHEFLIPVNHLDLSTTTCVNVKMTKEGKDFYKNSRYVSYKY